MKLTVNRDTLGRTNSQDYTLGNNTTHVIDTVARSQSGQITSGTENGQAKTYTYDKAGRLTNATLGASSWSYGFGTTPAGQCTGTPGTNYNQNASKNSNRTTTTQTVAGVTKTNTYCYVYPPDPVNDMDLSGQFGMKDFANVASIGSIIPGPIGMISAGVSAAAYAKAGDKKQALMMASCIALAAIPGAVGAAKVYQAAKSAKATITVARLGQINKLTVHGNSLNSI